MSLEIKYRLKDVLEELKVKIIPASPGWRIVYRNVKNIEFGEEVIAWQICGNIHNGLPNYQVQPIPVNGEIGWDWIATQKPDGNFIDIHGKPVSYCELDTLERYIDFEMRKKREEREL